MTQRTRAIPDDLLLSNRIYDLPRASRLIPEQVTMLTGLGEDQQRERRRHVPPQPPYPFERENNREFVWYPLGEVLDYNLSRMPKKPEPPKAKRKFSTFSTFVEQAALTDEWPITVTGDGQPLDFFGALIRGDELDERAKCVWMTLGEYLGVRRKWADKEDAEKTTGGLEEALGAARSPTIRRTIKPDADG